MAGWKIPELNGGLNRKITDKWSSFQHAMFDYQRVYILTLGMATSVSHGCDLQRKNSPNGSLWLVALGSGIQTEPIPGHVLDGWFGNIYMLWNSGRNIVEACLPIFGRFL